MKIKIKRLEKLIDHLKSLKNPDTFDMSVWGDFDEERLTELKIRKGKDIAKRLVRKGDCETVACIAGHARLLAEPGKKVYFDGDYSDDSKDIARDWLGLDYNQAQRLFIPYDYDYTSTSLEHSIRVLEHLRDTAKAGDLEINWCLPEPH